MAELSTIARPYAEAAFRTAKDAKALPAWNDLIAELAAVADRPVWLERVDGHAGWANSAALKAAAISPTTPDPAGGRVERLGTTRQPAGVFVDAAQALVQKVVPRPRPEDRDLALATAQDLFLPRGLTAVADMGTSIDIISST